MYLGETIALIVAVSWTVTAMFAEIASKRIGQLAVNIVRMALSLVFLAALLWIVTGAPYPRFAGKEAWLWLVASGLVGYLFGDYCLFNSYLVIGSRFGQLFMTLSSVFAAFAGFLLIGEKLSWTALLAMTITLCGIGLSVMSKSSPEEGGEAHLKLKLPIKGVMLGLGAALGQGFGLVLSKQGMISYEAGAAANAYPALMVPFAGTYIRAIAGLIGFLAMAAVQCKFGDLRNAMHEKKGLWATCGATVFGPFIGVSLSLMAIQHTATGIAQTIMALTPVLILLPAHIFFKQKITPLEILGACISVAGVSLFFI